MKQFVDFSLKRCSKGRYNNQLGLAKLASAQFEPQLNHWTCFRKIKEFMFRYLVLFMGMIPPLISGNTLSDSIVEKSIPGVETFEFTSNGITKTGKLFIPEAYKDNKNLPAIYLIDYTETHFKLATDEFEQVIAGVQQLHGVDALVVALDGIPDIDAEPDGFQDHYNVFRDMAAFVSGRYTNNPSRTFIGKGSESGVVLMALFLEDIESSVFENYIATDPSGLYASAIIQLLENEDIPIRKSERRLHFSFSTSNDRNKCVELINRINEAKFPWLVFESVEYTNSNYDNTYPISYAAGIAFVFKNYIP